MDNLTLPESDRDQLGKKLTSWTSAVVDGLTDHKERVDLNEKLYRLQPYDRANKPFGEDSCSISMPLMTVYVDSLVGNVSTAITQQSPYFSYKTWGKGHEVRDVVEDCSQWWLRHSDFDRKMKMHALLTGLAGRATYRLTYEEQAKGFHAGGADSYVPQDGGTELDGIEVGYCGLNLEVIHIHDTVVYPATFPDIKRARFVGHRFYLYQHEIVEQCEAGKYYEDSQYAMPSDNPSEHDVGKDSEWDGVADTSDGAEDHPVECFTGIAKLDIEDKGAFRYYEVAFIQSTGKMLFIKPYEYDRPWYFSPAFHAEYDKFYYAGSVAQSLQGLQLLKNELIGLGVDGALISAFPTVFFNARGGYTEDQFVQAKPGRMYPVNGDPSFATVSGTFDPEFIPQLLAYIDGMAESVVRVPRTSNLQSFQKGTTATEVDALQQAAAVSTNDYLLTYAGNELCDMVDFGRTLMYHNFDRIKQVWGDAFPAESADQLVAGGVFEVTGKTPSESPESRRAVADQLLQIKMATGTPRIDGDELIQGIVEDSGLPNAEQIYVSPEEEQENLLMAQMAQMQAMGMGGIGGMNGFGNSGFEDASLAGMGSIPGMV